MTPPGTPIANTVLDGRYTLVAPLADRGRGETWKARLTQSRNRFVAVKFLRALPPGDAVFPPALARTLDALKSLHQARVLSAHPTNILATARHGLWEGRPFLVQDLFEGPSLAAGIDPSWREGHPLPLDGVALFFEQVALALAAAHAAPVAVLHGALDAGCVFIQRLPRKGFELRVADFGIAPYADAPTSADSRSVGALDFRAPELRAGAAPTVASDVFALGSLLRVMLAAPPPHGAVLPPIEHCRPHADVSSALWSVILRANDARPDARHPSVQSLLGAFQSALAAGPDAPRPQLSVPAATALRPAPPRPEESETIVSPMAPFAESPPGDTLLLTSFPTDQNPWELTEDRTHVSACEDILDLAPTTAVTPPVAFDATVAAPPPVRVQEHVRPPARREREHTPPERAQPATPWKTVILGALGVALVLLAPLILWLLYSRSRAP